MVRSPLADLAAPEGTVVGCLGPNGAGKSTALRILAGLSRASSGQAWVAGHTVSLNSPSLQRIIGYLPDTPAFYGWLSGREYLTFAGRLFSLSGKEVRHRSDELLEMVELAGVADRRIGGYSRGMKHRLGIAQALINRPKVLLMDESTSALDPMGRMANLSTLDCGEPVLLPAHGKPVEPYERAAPTTSVDLSMFPRIMAASGWRML